jgi:hypothetical protein
VEQAVFGRKDNQAISVLSKEFTKLLVSLIPGVGPLQGVLSTTASVIVDRALRKSDAGSVETTVHRISDQVSKEILKELRAEFGSQREGATISALYDLRDTLRAAKLSVATLIQIQLDPHSLQEELLEYQPSEMRLASPERRRVYLHAVRLCSEYIIAAVPELPGFQLSLSQALLHQQNEIIRFCQKILDKLE